MSIDNSYEKKLRDSYVKAIKETKIPTHEQLKNLKLDRHLGEDRAKNAFGAYTFDSLEEVDELLQEVFSDEYTIKFIAKQLVYMEDCSKFSFVFPSEKTRGFFIASTVYKKRSCMAEFTLRPIEIGISGEEKSKRTGYPFEICSITLIDDEEQEKIRR